ncbi:hypothetical protein Sango_2053100 [Sesamum angolense]|uniref:Reverse transcriptase domain-containing protein n=1 Tax=Sesamum angolense TaxID=2727404 RepID=A0AAE1WG48_9LAMI|nr:hypothetical protein Sango_2053100 [Sesamum angolense]
MAFVPGRTINENSILSHEIMHYIHRKQGRKRVMAIKIDLTKAYDRMEWKPLIQLLEKLGMCEVMTRWINQCISSPSFLILFNGAPFDYFQQTRGIRSGDPLSPYLFIIYAEILSRLIFFEEEKGNLKGIKICRNAPPISHLFYADDITIFCRADERDAQAVQRCLSKFEN